jgi:hypothetical protein
MTELFLPRVCQTSLSELFFSADNVTAVQHGIRYGVFVQTQGRHVIHEQSPDELIIVMRSIYLQFGRNDERDVLCQVRSLNRRVLDFCVPRVVLELRAHKKHLAEVDVNPVPVLDRAVNISQKGSRLLETRRL